MAIQQSVNQLLGQFVIGAGLYAHSPEAQKGAQVRQLRKDVAEGEERALSAEKGYQRAGYGPEEAQVKAHPIREEVIRSKKELARLTNAGPEVYEDIAYDEEMLEVQKEELEQKIAKSRGLDHSVAVGIQKVQNDISTQDHIDAILQGAKSSGYGPRKMKKLKRSLSGIKGEDE